MFGLALRHLRCCDARGHGGQNAHYPRDHHAAPRAVTALNTGHGWCSPRAIVLDSTAVPRQAEPSGASHKRTLPEKFRHCRMAEFEGLDASAEASFHRGVTVAFLVTFTSKHDIWEMPTWQVQRNVIKPATAETKCRFTELEGSDVGPSDVFISHTWGAPWGNLVAAVAAVCAPTTRVWCDLFAVRQWPNNSMDLEFGGVVRRCKAFLLVCSPSSEVAK